jgi:hypothetical protein
MNCMSRNTVHNIDEDIPKNLDEKTAEDQGISQCSWPVWISIN